VFIVQGKKNLSKRGTIRGGEGRSPEKGGGTGWGGKNLRKGKKTIRDRNEFFWRRNLQGAIGGMGLLHWGGGDFLVG